MKKKKNFEAWFIQLKVCRTFAKHIGLRMWKVENPYIIWGQVVEVARKFNFICKCVEVKWVFLNVADRWIGKYNLRFENESSKLCNACYACLSL